VALGRPPLPGRGDARRAFPELPYVDCQDPAMATTLRGLIDADRGRNGRFIVLGWARPALVRGAAPQLERSGFGEEPREQHVECLYREPQ
jgi:hypothetical protein